MPATIKLEDVIHISSIGNIAIFKVVSGVLKPNMKATIGNDTVTVKTIQLNRKNVDEAMHGASYGAHFENSQLKVLQDLKGSEINFK